MVMWYASEDSGGSSVASAAERWLHDLACLVEPACAGISVGHAASMCGHQSTGFPQGNPVEKGNPGERLLVSKEGRGLAGRPQRPHCVTNVLPGCSCIAGGS